MKKETGTEPKFKTKTNPKAEPALHELFLDGIIGYILGRKPIGEVAA